MYLVQLNKSYCCQRKVTGTYFIGKLCYTSQIPTSYLRYTTTNSCLGVNSCFYFYRIIINKVFLRLANQIPSKMVLFLKLGINIINRPWSTEIVVMISTRHRVVTRDSYQVSVASIGELNDVTIDKIHNTYRNNQLGTILKQKSFITNISEVKIEIWAD